MTTIACPTCGQSVAEAPAPRSLPPAVLEEIQHVSDFLAQRCRRDVGARADSADVTAAYRQVARRATSPQVIGRALGALGVARTRSHGRRYYLDLVLRS